MNETLPKGWTKTPLLTIGRYIRGVSYKKNVVRFEQQQNYMPLLRANNIDGTVKFVDLQFVPTSIVKESQLLQKGDILIAMSSGSKRVVGKTATISENCENTTFGAFCGVIRSFDLLKDGVFKYFFQTEYYRKRISELATGTNINNIKISYFDAIDIPLPPLNEQKRIVAKLDKIIPRIDSVKARLDRIPALIKRFRQSVLTAAVTGRLTEKWREEHPEVGEWQNLSLKAICKSISDGNHQAPPKEKTGIPFLVISNIKNGKIDFASVTRFVSEEYFNSLKAIRIPKPTDILYTVTGSIGQAVIVKDDMRFCFQRHIGIIKPDSEYVTSEYLNYFLNTENAMNQGRGCATGTAQLTIPLTGLRKYVVPVPTLEEQKEIVKQVNKLFALANKLELHYQNAKSKTDKITQSVLAKAFRGELVPQDPNDEPAEKLLERILEEKAKLEAANKKTGKPGTKNKKRMK